MKKLLVSIILVGALLASAQGQAAPATPALESSASNAKAEDATLAAQGQNLAPLFKAREFKHGETSLKYYLFTPANLEAGKRYPLTLCLPEAAAGGTGRIRDYGALAFAANDFQAKYPSFALVPQFTDATIDGREWRTKETELLAPLIGELIKTNPVDPRRAYVTGQGKGGELAAYLNAEYPDLFAASLYVDCYWNKKSLPQLIRKPFIFVGVEETGESAAFAQAIDEACREGNTNFTAASWSAKLPIATQDDVARTMLEKGAPINLFSFEKGTVLSEAGKGSEGISVFEATYRLEPLRAWLFKQVLKP